MRKTLDYLRLVNAAYQRNGELEEAVVEVEQLLFRLLGCVSWLRYGECVGCGVNPKETSLHKSDCPIIQARQLRQQRSDDPLERLLVLRTVEEPRGE